MTGHRLPPRPGEVLDRTRPVRFRWTGTAYTGLEGDTIVSALLANGVTVFSRSFKYHRPRGVLSASFVDPNCTVQVDDEPNVRGAHRRVRAGMDVRPQNVWPSLAFDVKAANQLVGRALTPGFYYKTFMRPRSLWPLYQRVLSTFASGGVVDAGTGPPAAGHEAPGGAYYDKRHVHVDVLVAGGGPAGMAAALAAADAGADVLLVEEESDLGGHLRWGGEADLAALAGLRARVLAHPGVETLVDSVVAARYDENWIGVLQRSHPGCVERLVKVRTATLVVAPGLIERPFVFAGNDLPGVMLSTAARRLTNLHAIRLGTSAVVVSANAEGDAAAADLRSAGLDVRVLDARAGEVVRQARGRRGRLSEVVLADGSRVPADLLVTGTGWTAPTSLLNMAGGRPEWDDASARFRPAGDLPPSVLAAGGVTGDGTTAEIVAHGSTVGAEAARRARGERPQAVPRMPAARHPALFLGPTSGLVDFSEDVSSKDVKAAVAEGFDSAELAKRFTTATMGPSQGKLELVNTVAAIAAATGSTIAEVGTTVWRPPYVPISLGALAGRHAEPTRTSPMHPWHVAHGMVPLVAGQWIRPDHYGDPAAEVLTVRERVGLIDVTPLGKLDLRGPDVPALLEHVYVNTWKNLAVGSVRYGVMCAEDGVVLDDGVTGRLGEEHYVMSTTSSGAATVWEWLENWLQTGGRGWRVHVTPLTTAYASINVAGPRSRELLGRLVEGVDLSGEAFGYMRVRTGRIAGVDDCLMWRIGFTGELSFEIHVPAGFGLHVWETLLEAGADLGVGVFGVEAQRVLRLEKGHFIVGQDTDGLTRAGSAGLGGLVKLGKDDFVGRPELAWFDAEASPTLVALQPVDGAVVPPEASQIVRGATTIAGRVTSSRMSPTLGRSVCLAQLARDLATPGTVVTVVLPSGERVGATVMPHLAHVDPEGVRLRA
jgi:sarcosine oxidase subunit alpha